MADNLPKLVPWGNDFGKEGPILAVKVVQGTTFDRFFCQNQSDKFREDRFKYDRLSMTDLI